MISSRRLVFVLATILGVPALAFGQVAEQNVNMVAGTSLPGGDPWLQRQNEPSIAISTRNPLHLLGGANDYRTVDMPGLPDGEETGDAWLGIFRSKNAGQTWQSTLIPGYPQDGSAVGIGSPLKGFQAAADPVVRAGANGMFYYSGIVLNRDPKNPLGGVFVARFIDNNNTEVGDPVSYLDTTMIDRGTAGQFIDKPWLAVGPGAPNAKPCTVSGQTFAAQNVYLAYTVFVGSANNLRTKILLARSTDCGATWQPGAMLSEENQVNQGPVIAVAPNGDVYVAWRRFKSATQTDAILLAKSTNQGKTFSKGSLVAEITPFEQGTTTVSMRTTAYPALAVDANGRAYVAWSQRAGPNGDARVVLTSSTDGTTWTPATYVDPSPNRGHEFMPSLTFAGGKLLVVYYDLREDHTIGIYTPLGGGQYSEARQPVGGDPDATVFTNYLMDVAPAGMPPIKRRHTIDLRAAQSDGGLMPAFQSARVSRYVFGSRPGSSTIEQLQIDVPNLPMFKLGTVPFFGDYIDVAGVASPNNGAPVFHATWTDNRDVRPPLDLDWTHYTPVGPGHNRTSGFSGGAVPDCVPGQTGMRNQNIYTARISEGLFAGSPGNAKQLGKIQRAFAVFVQNATDSTATFRLTIVQQPPNGTASFLQSTPLTQLDVTIPRHSSATRSVFVQSSNAHAQVDVHIAQLGGTLSTDVILNPDVSNPDVSNPDVSNPDVSNAEVYNPDVSNPDVSNPDVSNPDVSNPDVSNPDVSNPDVSNPDVSNPDVSNPDVSNPDVSNPDVSNPDVSNTDVNNSSVSDTTWTAGNTGNTTSGYTLHLMGNVPAGLKTQLIVNRIYETPVARDCTLGVEKHRQVIANIVDPMFVSSVADATDPALTDNSATSATFWLDPHDTVRITLRVFDPTNTFIAATAITPVIVAQAINTANLPDGRPSTTFVPQSRPAGVAAGFGQLAALSGANFPNPSIITVKFSDGIVNEPGFVFQSPSSSSLVFARLPFVGDELQTATNLQPGPIVATLTWDGGKLSVPMTLSATPGTPQIRFVLPAFCGDGCQLGRLPTTTTSVFFGSALGFSAFGVDTVGAKVRFRQSGHPDVILSGAETTFSGATIGVVPVFEVPNTLVPGPVEISMATTVNGIDSAWSAPVTLNVTPVSQ